MVAMTGETKAAVSVALSRLRKSGLIPVGGRGPYAIDMDAAAAMRLLIALCASVSLEADSATKAVERFEDLPSRPPRVFPDEAGDEATSIVMLLDELGEEHTVGDALKQIIDAAKRNELFTYLEGATGKRKKAFRHPDTRGYLSVQFMLPIPQVRIEHQFSGWLRKTWIYGHDAIEFEQYNRTCLAQGLGDRARLVTVSEATIEAIGRTLAG
ncbi:MAG: hypothetical protein EKK33_01395 [Bradyrhizobiaceae bacterium]|nr:MAG: hypothetical protein EKK33_01395 [Bradyrhizobiaceae bacterium]